MSPDINGKDPKPKQICLTDDLMNITKPISASLDAIINNPRALIPIGAYYIAVAVILGVIAILVPGFWLAKAFFHTGSINPTLLSNIGSSLLVLMLLVAVFVFYVPSVLLNGIFIGIGKQLRSKSKVNLKQAAAVAKAKYVDLFFAGILFAAVAITVIIAFCGLSYLLIQYAKYLWPVAILSLVVMALLLAICIIYFFLINAAIIIGDNNLEDGIRQSFSIGRAHGLEIFFVLVLMGIIFLIVDIGAAVIAIIPVLGWAIYFLVSMFLATWFGVLPVFVYYDLTGIKTKHG